MKRSNLQLVVLLGLVLVIVFLTGCGGSADESAAAPAADSEASAGDASGGNSEAQPPTGENGGPQGQGMPMGGAAFSGATQLAMGMLYLQSTDYPITAEQAATLLPLWQDYQSQQAAEDFDTEQAESLLTDIEAGLTGDQQAAIEAVTQDDLFAWAQDQGLMGDFAQDGDRPNFDDMSDEQRATLQAQGGGQQGPPEDGQGGPPEGGTPQGGGPQGGFRGGGASPLIDAVIAMLEDLA